MVSATAHPSDAESHSRCHGVTHGAVPLARGGDMTPARTPVDAGRCDACLSEGVVVQEVDKLAGGELSRDIFICIV